VDDGEVGGVEEGGGVFSGSEGGGGVETYG